MRFFRVLTSSRIPENTLPKADDCARGFQQISVKQLKDWEEEYDNIYHHGKCAPSETFADLR